MVQTGIEEARLAVEAIDLQLMAHEPKDHTKLSTTHFLGRLVEFRSKERSYIWKRVTSTARSVTDTRGKMKFQCLSVIKTGREHILPRKLMESLLASKIVYARSIGDGDSSVHRKLIKKLPYGPNLLVQKNECQNHIFRNYGNRLRDICMKKNYENVELRSLIQQNLLRLRTAVTKAVSYRKAQKDAIFEVNHVPEMKANGLFLEILSAASRVSYHADSLIEYVDINCIELYKSHIAKAVGVNCVNLCLRQSYQVRCQSAVIAYNKKDELHRVIHKTLNNKSPCKNSPN
ncbi:hypothetical protein PR048_008687 [Dryococelus australis]|uniref:Mutator-like transposase domain-containing protein n=1 Tax=Dryococelus australis TaxID=614101 RepID=A0ABQ9HXV0_9NEOP|nr:hypothetical protein PR048_008687 [Dryococelus australis]